MTRQELIALKDSLFSDLINFHLDLVTADQWTDKEIRFLVSRCVVYALLCHHRAGEQAEDGLAIAREKAHWVSLLLRRMASSPVNVAEVAAQAEALVLSIGEKGGEHGA